MMVPVLTLKQLESASGRPRSTIYYYLGRGLLPKPQKTSTGRSLYSEDHLNLLLEIEKLQRGGLSLLEIQRGLHHKVVQADETGIDLAKQEYERLHNRILAVAADEFSTKGYKQTHINEIIRRLGITVTVFYSHFPSKHALLAECVVVLMEWGDQYVEYQRPLIHDGVEELLWSLFSQFRVFQLGGAARAVVEVEGPDKCGRLEKSIAAAHATIVDRIARIVWEYTTPEGQSSGVAPELVAEGLFGASDLLYRFSTQEHGRKELIRAIVYLHLAVLDAHSGKLDIDAEMKRYDKLIDYISTHMPPLPPVLEL